VEVLLVLRAASSAVKIERREVRTEVVRWALVRSARRLLRVSSAGAWMIGVLVVLADGLGMAEAEGERAVACGALRAMRRAASSRAAVRSASFVS